MLELARSPGLVFMDSDWLMPHSPCKAISGVLQYTPTFGTIGGQMRINIACMDCVAMHHACQLLSSVSKHAALAERATDNVKAYNLSRRRAKQRRV